MRVVPCQQRLRLRPHRLPFVPLSRSGSSYRPQGGGFPSLRFFAFRACCVHDQEDPERKQAGPARRRRGGAGARTGAVSAEAWIFRDPPAATLGERRRGRNCSMDAAVAVIPQCSAPSRRVRLGALCPAPGAGYPGARQPVPRAQGGGPYRLEARPGCAAADRRAFDGAGARARCGFRHIRPRTAGNARPIGRCGSGTGEAERHFRCDLRIIVSARQNFLVRAPCSRRNFEIKYYILL